MVKSTGQQTTSFPIDHIFYVCVDLCACLCFLFCNPNKYLMDHEAWWSKKKYQKTEGRRQRKNVIKRLYWWMLKISCDRWVKEELTRALKEALSKQQEQTCWNSQTLLLLHLGLHLAEVAPFHWHVNFVWYFSFYQCE